MTPFDASRAVYRREPCARTFESDLWHHFQNGYVLSGPEGFVMGRPVRRDAETSQILNPAVTFEDPDCWHIWLAAGDWRAMLAGWLPYPLPWFSWERRNRLRFWRAERVIDISALTPRCSPCSMNSETLAARTMTAP